jgi:ankyrin repeat protein
LFKDASDGSEEDEDTEEITYEFAWELPPLNANFLSDLYSLFKRDSNSLPRALLFALYQSLLRYPKDSNAALEVLIASASLGYEPAGEAVPATYQLLGMEIPVDISGKVLKWLERAVATGSVLAKPYLEQSNLESLTCSLTAFQNSGGYNTYYSFVNPSERHSGSERNTEYSKLHWLAAYGSAAALVEYLSNEHNFHINEMTEDEETPLYLAAARGSWEHAKVLLSHGACPSIKCTPFEISCMHWLFAFEKTTQRVAATEFIRYGAELDALASYEVPFYHYPFVLPSGSPLHWAVATSSHQTVQVLLQLGANALLRDGSDPYVYDDPFGSRIHKLGGPNLDIYSVSETPTLGLSPLDLAAMQHDPSIFEVMLSMKKLIDINASDEEGFSVLHRLGTKREGRTRLEQPFRFLSFRPYLNTPYKALEYTIEKIISLGGDLNKLTTPTETEARQSLSADSMEQHRTFTPLMLALHNHACDVVQALLALGASVVVENTLGETVLHHLPSGVMGEKPNEELLGSVKLLVSHGADIHHRSKIGVEPVLKAATSISLDVMDFFLSIGANIDARVQSKNAVDVGSNIFFFLAHEHCITIDVKVANMLEKYVFSSSDAEKRRNVIEVGDIEGLTLLHAFARALMPSCVKTLLKHGAPVNALHKRSTEKGRVRSTWYNTPLDTVLAEKATKEKRMAETRHLSLKEYTHMCQMADNMIAILENAGGISNRQKVMETPSASSERM